MHVALTPAQEQLRSELQHYFADLVTPEIRRGLSSATGEFGETTVYKDVIRQVGKDGWLGIGWPKEYGGQARTMVEQLIFTDVAAVAGVPITLQDFDDFAARVPVIVNLRPSGAWLMEDYHIAGGTLALLSRLKSMLHLDAITVTGTVEDAIGGAEVYNDDVIRPLNNPIAASGGTAILYGNLAPDGCVMKPPAMGSSRFFTTKNGNATEKPVLPSMYSAAEIDLEKVSRSAQRANCLRLPVGTSSGQSGLPLSAMKGFRCGSTPSADGNGRSS